MARTKFHETPESGRICTNLSKRQLKEFKKMSIEFEMSVEDIYKVAIDLFIRRYQNTTTEEIDKHGINSMLNDA